MSIFGATMRHLDKSRETSAVDDRQSSQPNVSAIDDKITSNIANKIMEVTGEGHAPTSYFPPNKYDFTLKNKNNDVVEEMSFTLSLPQKIFLFLERSDCCVLAQYSSYIMMLTIVVSCVCFVLSSVDDFRYTPSSCDHPACENDETLCPNTTICEPVQNDFFSVIETCCVIIFTLDYGLRMVTVPFVPPRLAHLLPADADPDLTHQEDEDRNSNGNKPKAKGGGNDPEFTWYHKLWAYGTKPFNVIDALAIIPYYIAHLAADFGSEFIILRVLRLVRVLRILKSKSMRTGFTIIQKALLASIPALSILYFLSMLLVLLFGSIIYFCEVGEFTVNDAFPEGAYIRWNIDWSEKEQSPFSSILLSIYWAIVTATTVGYGDFYPTTTLGRITAICLMYVGIIAISLPISIVGSSFDREYRLVHHDPEDEVNKHDNNKYSGTKAENRREMMKNMKEIAQTMQDISTRMEIIGAHLLEESLREDEDEDESLTLSFAAVASAAPPKKSSAPPEVLCSTKNKILEMTSNDE